jgi:hypothetical protein
MVIFDAHDWMDYLLIGLTYHDVMTCDPWRACSFVIVGPSWWTVLGEQA